MYDIDLVLTQTLLGLEGLVLCLILMFQVPTRSAAKYNAVGLYYALCLAGLSGAYVTYLGYDKIFQDLAYKLWVLSMICVGAGVFCLLNFGILTSFTESAKTIFLLLNVGILAWYISIVLQTNNNFVLHDYLRLHDFGFFRQAL